MIFKQTKSLIRSNVKLSTNVKINVTSNDKLYLNSFDGINKTISSNRYKNVSINPNSSYQHDLFNFWGKGKTPSSYVFDLGNEDYTKIKNNFNEQYHNTYISGCYINKNKKHDEEMAYFAPIWLSDTIPSNFVIYRVKETGTLNTKEDILNNSEIVKTFDLSENTSIGKYLRTHINDDNFPKFPISVDYNEQAFIKYRGISLKRGGFTSSPETVNDTFYKDTPMIYFEDQITKGFERKNTVCANIMNLEFLFDDVHDSGYGAYRYIGFYADLEKEGNTIVNNITTLNNKHTLSTSDELYNSVELKNRDTLYYIKTENLVLKNFIQDVTNSTLVTSNVTNPNDVLVNSITNSFTTASSRVNYRGKQVAQIKLNGPIASGNYLYIGLTNVSNQVFATDTLLAGNSSGLYFSNKGTTQENLRALKGAITHISDDLNVFIQNDILVIVVDTTLPNNDYVKVSINESVYDSSIVLINDGKFSGGYTNLNNKVAISSEYKLFIEENINALFVKNKIGNLTKVTGVLPYTDTPTFDEDNKINGFNNTDNRIIVEFEDDIIVGNNINFFNKPIIEYGRLSLLDVVDFDFDFYSTEYGINIWDIFYIKMFYTNSNTVELNDIEQFVDAIFNGYSNSVKLNFIIKNKSDYITSLKTLELIYNYELTHNNSTTNKTLILNKINAVITEFNKFTSDNFSYIVDITVDLNSSVLTLNLNDSIKEMIMLIGNDIDGTITDNINSEYDRLNENATKEFAIASRVNPYITKWVNKDNDVKNNNYRLNSNLAFGVNNFTPSFELKTPTPQHFTHEWYYLGGFPSSEKKILGNYVNVVQDRQFKEINTFFENEFSLSEYLSNKTNYFEEYFTTERIPYYENNTLKYEYISPEKKFTEFDRNSVFDFSSTFFRGVKLYVKTLKERYAVNNNLGSLEYVYNNELSDYKFSCILQPKYYEYNVEYTNNNITKIEVLNDGYKNENIEFNVYKNDKYKNITFIINVNIPYIKNIQNQKIKLDHNLLYNVNSLSFFSGTNKVFLPTPISGTLDLSQQVTLNEYKGIENRLGTKTKFLSEIVDDNEGNINTELIVLELNNEVDDVIRYKVKDITTVSADNLLNANTIEVVQPPLELSDEYYRKTVLFKTSGGKDFFKEIAENVSFANIFNLVNSGDAQIKYHTITENNELISGSTNYILEFERPTKFSTNNSIKTVNDDTVINSLLIKNNTVGYNFKLKDVPSTTMIHRYKGEYTTKFNSIIKFTDVGLPEKLKNKNIQIDFSNSGIVNNYYYNKTSLKTNKSILNSKRSLTEPLYPLLGETAIDLTNKNIFMSSWDNNFFINQINKTVNSRIPGSYDVTDSKNFFGSVIFSVPDEFKIDTLNEQNLNYDLLDDKITININYSKQFNDIIYTNVTTVLDQFIDYTKTTYRTKEEFIQEYINKNIINRFSLNSIGLYKLETNIKRPELKTINNLNDNLLLNYNFKRISDFAIEYTDISRFNVRLINKLSTIKKYNYYFVIAKITKNKKL